MVYGYARVSSVDGRQTTDLQLDALRAAGCQRIFEDRMSGARNDRPGLTELLQVVQRSDIVIVWKIDRLGRSVQHLLSTIKLLQDKGVGFKSVTESIDTSTPSGRFLLTVLSAISAMEREIIIERTRSGLAAAKARGRVGGRPSKLTEEQVRLARQLLQDPTNSIASVCRTLGIGKATFYRKIKPR